ncbi:MAG: CBM9 family sugar-binding protein, partial [Treponema sp.]|nr:CBM9 family sugar-binding protein [Treponema sp.]
MRRISWFGLLLAFVTLIAACSNATSPQSLSGAASGSQRSITDEFGDTYLLPYSPYDYEVLLAKFAPATAGDSNIFLVDGKLNPAVWDGAAAAQVDNFKNASGAATATSGVSGTLKAVWDGYTLYLAVTAGDNTVSKNNTIENNTSRIVNFTDTNNWTNFDGVEFDIDFLNEKTHRGDNNILGKVKVTRGGKLVGTRLSGSNGQAAIFGDPYTNVDHQEFTDRLKSWGAYEAGQGYVAWLAVEIYAGADPANGMAFGFDVIIQDSPADSQAVTQKTYWSHNDNSYYTDSSSNMSMTLDWGTIVLSGHTGDTSNFAYSDWMLTNPIRWAKGDPWWPPTTPTNFSYLINLPDAVADSWEPTSWTAFQNAITAGKAKLTQADSWGRPHINFAVTSQAEVKTLAQAVEAGIVNLRWADDLLGATELDAAPLNTLSDPLRFKTNGDITPNETIPGLTGRKGTLVASAADWALRVREIKALAALYEYGPIPDAPASHSVVIQSTPRVPAHWEHPGWWIVGGLPSKVDETPGAYSLTATYTYNGTESASWDGTAETKIAGLNAQPGTMTDAYTFSFPSEADKAANGVTGAVPVVLSFSGSTQAYLTRGIAIVNVPTTVTTDDRQNAWRGRDGTFRAFYPYSRGMRYEISNEMAAAWGSSRAADALYDAAEMDIIETPITIANVVSSSDFQLGDRLSADGVTWWTVGQITGAETP